MNKKDAIIIMGTAHLGTTPGKQSPDGQLKEAVYSRERVDAIAVKLKAYGYTVFTDYMPLEPNSYMKSKTAKEEQSKELQYRVNFVNGLCREYGVENCLYVNIHVDAAGIGTEWNQAGGFTVYTTKGQTEADKLAECLYDAAEQNLKEYAEKMYDGKAKGFYGVNQQPIRTDTTDRDRDREADYYVLRKTQCPAVLTENLFQDNKCDVDFLLSDAGKHAIERLHVEGIMRYIEEN
jgi:N-acetylmuramoyl-L-alanine amidase